MKANSIIALVIFAIGCTAPNDNSVVKELLLEQLTNTHTNKDWYVPASIAVEGLTPEQALYQDSAETHTISQLVSHLIFWNERILLAFQGQTPPDFDGNNELTFSKFDNNWPHAANTLDSLQTAWEEAVSQASHDQIEEWRSSIANLASHNAYHTGQIVFIRKRNGWWNESQGVQ